MDGIKRYDGRIPACGVFCGGCPVYIRDKRPCSGAGLNPEKCERCKSFHQCCVKRGISRCHECRNFPCYRFRRFAQSWTKYGQDLIANQRLIAEKGTKTFLAHYNSKT